ncbi:MAG: PspC domain-containing protein [Chitinispirillaceae bacterium]|nr:PspC domain-containing protein [Chitinispirillaceae bacterium]
MKQIYRIESEKKIAGICAGLAHTFNADVTVVRLIAVFATVLTALWPGIITYLVGWYLIPVKEPQALGRDGSGRE